jgi:hypothetical protein
VVRFRRNSSVLAERAQITKQSMAELVMQLERHGYVEGVPDSDGPAREARSGHHTRPGGLRDREFVVDVEAEWTEKLGERKIATLRSLPKELNEKP